MRMVYLYNEFDVTNDTEIGIQKKQLMQMNAFKECGYEPFYVYFDYLRVIVIDVSTNDIKIQYASSANEAYDLVKKLVTKLQPNFVYIRYRFIEDHYIYNLYKWLGENFEKCILEIPTYPYDDEYEEDNPIIVNDKFYRKGLHNIFRYSTNFNGKNEVFKIPSLNLYNGIDLNMVRIKREVDNKVKNSINLIGVATMAFWHAYDRIIEGMNRYYNGSSHNYDINFYMVGKGTESVKYHQMILDYELENHVFELGVITDQEKLDELFDGMDIAVGAIGSKRRSNTNCDGGIAIKSAEYCARGIPYIVDYKDGVMKYCPECILKIPDVDTPIKMEDIINFYENINLNEARLKMRSFAEQKLSWGPQLSNMLKHFSIE